MKKGFVLIDIIIAFSLTSIILMVVLSVSLFSSKIISRTEEENDIQNDFTQIEFFFQNFITNSSITVDSNTKMTDSLGNILEFKDSILYYNNEVLFQRTNLVSLDIKQNENLLEINYTFNVKIKNDIITYQGLYFIAKSS